MLQLWWLLIAQDGGDQPKQIFTAESSWGTLGAPTGLHSQSIKWYNKNTIWSLDTTQEATEQKLIRIEACVRLDGHRRCSPQSKTNFLWSFVSQSLIPIRDLCAGIACTCHTTWDHENHKLWTKLDSQHTNPTSISAGGLLGMIGYIPRNSVSLAFDFP